MTGTKPMDAEKRAKMALSGIDPRKAGHTAFSQARNKTAEQIRQAEQAARADWDDLQRGVPSDRPTAVELALNQPMTADQQIRAKALECTCRMYATMDKEIGSMDADAFMASLQKVFWRDAAEFEAYIREGK